MQLQAPLSRVEKDLHLNDRYAAMEDRLAVSKAAQGAAACQNLFGGSALFELRV